MDTKWLEDFVSLAETGSYRERPSELHPGEPLVARLWAYLLQCSQAGIPLKLRSKRKQT